MATSVIGQPFIQDQDLSDQLTDIFNGDVLWGDYDGDGDLDILIAGSTLNGPITELYKNDSSNYITLNLGLTGLQNSSASWCDFDSDGDLDFLLTGTEITKNMNLPTAILFENVGNDNFEQFEAGLLGVYDGKSAWGDLDNDGDQDLILIGDKGEVGVTRIYRNNGATLFEVVDHDLSDVYNGDVALGDYDNDMDLDILIIGVVVNSAKEEEKVLKLYRNEGDFNFSGVYSEFIGMSESCLQWADYDSDGDLDILANGSTEAPTHLVYLYQNLNNDNFLNIGIEIFGTVNGSVSWGDYDVDGDFDFLLTGMPSYSSNPITVIYRNIDVNLFNKDDSVDLVEVHHSQANWGDYDNDGDLDLIMAGLSSQNNDLITKVYNNQNEIINTPPTAPFNLQSIIIGNSITLIWALSSDYETADAGLTYNIRVGTVPGGRDIMSPLSNNEGDLFVPALGNVNHNKTWILKDLSPGVYFWSVQAVDNNFKGSGFADETSFEIVVSGISDEELSENPNQVAISSYPNPFTEQTTFEITFTGHSPISAYIVDLNGRIVRTLANNRQMGKSLLIEWNGKNNQGEFLPEGLYHFVFRSAEIGKSCKVMMLK